MRIANRAFLGYVCMRIAGGEGESLSQRAPPEVPPSHIKPKRLRNQTFGGSSSSSSVVVIMASGVTVSDEVIRVFNEMKVRRASAGPAELSQRKKAALFCLSEDQRTIVLEPGKEVLVGDAVPDPYAAFVALLPERDCRYALYDATYETCETKKEDLVFVFWAPDCAPLKNKMIYASSKDAVKKKMPGIKHEVQATSLDEVKDRCTLAEKLGGRSVVSLEGKPL